MTKSGQSGGLKPKSHSKMGLSGRKFSPAGKISQSERDRIRTCNQWLAKQKAFGLKGQNRVCASYDQEPTISPRSIGRRLKKVSWMLILSSCKQKFVQWIFLPPLEMVDKNNCTTNFVELGLIPISPVRF
jgi:hypothetical protein